MAGTYGVVVNDAPIEVSICYIYSRLGIRDDSKSLKKLVPVRDGPNVFESIWSLSKSILAFSHFHRPGLRFWSVRSTTFIIKIYENTGNFSF